MKNNHTDRDGSENKSSILSKLETLQSRIPAANDIFAHLTELVGELEDRLVGRNALMEKMFLESHFPTHSSHGYVILIQFEFDELKVMYAPEREYVEKLVQDYISSRAFQAKAHKELGDDCFIEAGMSLVDLLIRFPDRDYCYLFNIIPLPDHAVQLNLD